MASCHIMFQRSSIDKLRRSSSCPSSDSVERRTIWRLAKLINPFYHFRARFAGATSLATRSEICHTSPPLAKPQAEIWPVFVRLFHSIGRAGCLAVVLGPLAGCAMWDAKKWNPAQYRDERASDIDQRLSSREPIVKNPF